MNHAIAVMGTTVGMVKMHLKIIFVCTMVRILAMEV
jgi:hypothetical protein